MALPLPLLPLSISSTMRTTRMPGMLCRSDVSTAVCVPGDPRSVVHPRRLHETATLSEKSRLISTHDHLKYSRLPADCRRFPAPGERRRSAVTLPLVTKRERVQPKEAPSAPPPLLLPSSSTDRVFQVVVMRVSIHCQGCAGKVRKHISKMEGVSSFSIDLETKRVTVMGHVSPVGVLESISKVKKAEFWTC